ncbi:hypothetical protein HMPREF1619_01986 [Klebsiella pneumoniae 909957]|nr:hypothetical protein HMPREF9538_00249 [Klebsiella sp. MS 92-3]ESB01783.1 hypothetical protein HMPREF1619_01986 [Klebsiella pneumoniae 909957]
MLLSYHHMSKPTAIRRIRCWADVIYAANNSFRPASSRISV